MALPLHWKNLHVHRSPTFIMGILNVTTDSFSDGGKFIETDEAVDHAMEMEENGADIIDIGGESTRPGAESVSLGIELNRVVPVIEAIRTHSDICISVDTTKSIVAEKSLESGADIVNDISGLQFDPGMKDVVVHRQVPVIIMHMKGQPATMQKNPHYDDLIEEIVVYFKERLAFCKRVGIKEKNIILDPGIGFGKTQEHNYQLLRELAKINQLGFPVLIGASRKSFIGLTLNTSADQRLEGTAAAVAASILNGAKMVRVHDVKEMKRVALIADEIRGLA